MSSKRTIASTKLNEGDRLVFVGTADGMDQTVMQTSGGAFLRFPLSELSVMKKNAAGTRGIKMKDGETVEHAYLLGGGAEFVITHHDRPFALNKVKLGKRGGAGVRPRQ